MALAQTTVTGKVVSQDDGEPVICASIKIEGTKTGTVTFVVDGVSIEGGDNNSTDTQRGGGYGYAGDYAYGADGDDMGTATIYGKEYLIPDYGMDESWGPKLDGRQVLSWYDLLTWKNNGSVGNPTTSAWSPASSDYRDFFKTGVSYTNNIAVSQSYDRCGLWYK